MELSGTSITLDALIRLETLLFGDCVFWFAIIGGAMDRREGRLGIVAVVATALTACSQQLVAPYNSDLQQRASAMEAEVSSWELTMRANAGTATDDPRNATLQQMLNKWRGDADAMLTLALSNDPQTISCSGAAQAVYQAIQSKVPEALRAQSSEAAKPATAPSECETALVDDINSGIDDIGTALKYCTLEWVPDSYYSFGNQGVVPSRAPAAPSARAQDQRTRSCLAEFKRPAVTTSTGDGSRHGRAVSHLLTTLEVIVYVETRKKAAATSK